MKKLIIILSLLLTSTFAYSYDKNDVYNFIVDMEPGYVYTVPVYDTDAIRTYSLNESGYDSEVRFIPSQEMLSWTEWTYVQRPGILTLQKVGNIVRVYYRDHDEVLWGVGYLWTQHEIIKEIIARRLQDKVNETKATMMQELEWNRRATAKEREKFWGTKSKKKLKY